MVGKSSLCTQILWENRFKGDVGNDCLVSVDGTDFRIHHSFSKKWFSHKFKGPGVRCEVALSIIGGDIVWIHGPFPCGYWSDLKIFRNALKFMLGDCERVEADDGHRGEPGKIKAASGLCTKAEKKMKAKVRSRHETVNKRFKQWGCLKQAFWRDDEQRHSSVFRAVAVITQLSIEDGEPLFGVKHDDSKFNL